MALAFNAATSNRWGKTDGASAASPRQTGPAPSGASSKATVSPARRSVADLQARAFTLDVQMVRSLGGGFTKA